MCPSKLMIMYLSWILLSRLSNGISMAPSMQNATSPHFGGSNEDTEIKGLSSPSPILCTSNPDPTASSFMPCSSWNLCLWPPNAKANTDGYACMQPRPAWPQETRHVWTLHIEEFSASSKSCCFTVLILFNPHNNLRIQSICPTLKNGELRAIAQIKTSSTRTGWGLWVPAPWSRAGAQSFHVCPLSLHEFSAAHIWILLEFGEPSQPIHI